jgi:hypothetical protein
MKKLLLSVVLLSIYSCSQKSPEEQMLFDYVDKWTIDVFKISSEDLDLKIESLVKVGGIKGKDSLVFYNNAHMDAWYMKELGQNQPKDSLTIKVMSDKTGRLIKVYEEIIDDYGDNKIYSELKKKYSKPLELLKKVKKEIDLIKSKIDYYKGKEDEVLSQKYNVKYTIENPILKKKQTFNRVYYTNKLGTKFTTYDNLK